MKIELMESDRNYINRINDTFETGETIPILIQDKDSYSVSFDIVDIAKANNFLMDVVMTWGRDDLNRAKEIEDLLGVRFTSVNFSKCDAKTSELKETLKRFLAELEEME